ncbi:hypothetical protein, partial [Streptomyces sp. McG5]|uniref:hypothetical protein n=1 Tax=Streptomyces sp. McG5 TaxID=2725484 RepID=UPI001BEB43CB
MSSQAEAVYALSSPGRRRELRGPVQGQVRVPLAQVAEISGQASQEPFSTTPQSISRPGVACDASAGNSLSNSLRPIPTPLA